MGNSLKPRLTNGVDHCVVRGTLPGYWNGPGHAVIRLFHSIESSLVQTTTLKHLNPEGFIDCVVW